MLIVAAVRLLANVGLFVWLTWAFTSPIASKKVKTAAIKQLPKTSASAEVKGMAQLSGFMCLFQAHNTLTYAEYKSNATCIKTANI